MIERLEPSELVLVGEGFSREDLKAHSLRGTVFSGKSVFTPVSLAREILRLSDAAAPEPASSLLRQEYLQLLLSHPQIEKIFPTLTAIQDQPGFWRKIDRALDAAQWSAIHSEERRVQLERLESAGAPKNSYRSEILSLLELWQGWCEGASRADEAQTVQIASQILSEKGLPEGLQFHRGVFWQNGLTESLLSHFVEELSRHLPLERCRLPTQGSEVRGEALTEERWHTVEDAVDRLGDLLVRELRNGVDPSRLVILIPDSQNEVRFALSRMLAEREITELDPRDPLELGIHEPHKNLFRPLELAVSGFERVALLSWLRLRGGLSDSTLAQCHRTLSDLGVREGWRGLSHLLGASDESTLTEELRRLEEASQKKLTLTELIELQRFYLSLPLLEAPQKEWLNRFWTDLEEDHRVLGLLGERFSLASWLERAKRRAQQTRAPLSKLRPRTGVRVVRLSQCNPGIHQPSVFLLGLDARWLSDALVGDLYLRGRDRDLLGSEFQVSSAFSARSARLSALASWRESAASFRILNYQYGMGGSEREDPTLVLKELGAEVHLELKGAHPRQKAGYALVKNARTRQLKLPPLLESAPSLELTATELEHVSRCAFLGTVFARWKAQSPQTPDLELWPTTQGTLLHAAVEELMKRLQQSSPHELGHVCEASLQAAWERLVARGQLKGWVPSPQLRTQIERKGVTLLRSFLEEEQRYRDRSQARFFAAEDQAKLSWEFEEAGKRFRISGKADRIDEHEDGLWVVDYKSGKQDVKGSDIREKGYRLQLPFYAIAARHQLDRPVLGVQFIELTREARRSVGLFPKKWNGKEKGNLTAVRANHSSLFDISPDELWPQLENHIRTKVSEFESGISDANPVIGTKECERCRARGVCGQTRREWVEGES